MSLQAAYVPVAFQNLSGTVTVTATASPGTTIISAPVPALPLFAVDVEITDVTLYNSSTAAVTATLQIFVSGFGLSSPIYAPIGHTTNAGQVSVGASSEYFIGNVRWYLPQGGAGVNLQTTGTIGFAVYASTASAIVVGASYEIVYGIFAGVV